MSKVEYYLGEIIGCTQKSQKEYIAYLVGLGYSAESINDDNIKITGIPLSSKEESEAVRNRKEHGVKLTVIIQDTWESLGFH